MMGYHVVAMLSLFFSLEQVAGHGPHQLAAFDILGGHHLWTYGPKERLFLFDTPYKYDRT